MSIIPYKNCNESEYDKPLCPLISYHHDSAFARSCMGESCVLCLDGECMFAKQMHLSIQKTEREYRDRMAEREAGDYICFGL